jgi:hypothetical protein
MTYCVGLLLNEGMVCLSDTRTNAGLDNISTYRKMFHFEHPGERVITVMTAGSLSITQTTLARLREAIDDPDATEETSIMLAPTMLKVASIIGRMLCEVRLEIDEKLATMKQAASASMIVAGQRKGGAMRLFLIYPEGNFIEATEDTPFLQIGEHKYGKPILDRVTNAYMPPLRRRTASRTHRNIPRTGRGFYGKSHLRSNHSWARCRSARMSRAIALQAEHLSPTQRAVFAWLQGTAPELAVVQAFHASFAKVKGATKHSTKRATAAAHRIARCVSKAIETPSGSGSFGTRESYESLRRDAVAAQTDTPFSDIFRGERASKSAHTYRVSPSSHSSSQTAANASAH